MDPAAYFKQFRTGPSDAERQQERQRQLEAHNQHIREHYDLNKKVMVVVVMPQVIEVDGELRAQRSEGLVADINETLYIHDVRFSNIPGARVVAVEDEELQREIAERVPDLVTYFQEEEELG